MNAECPIYLGLLQFFSNSILQFSVHKFCTCFVKFSPKYFILCEVDINLIIFLISFLDCSLLMFINTLKIVFDFCSLILFLQTCCTYLLVLISFVFPFFFSCVCSLAFFTYKIISSVNIDSLTSSFPVWMPFISFTCLIVLNSLCFEIISP